MTWPPNICRAEPCRQPPKRRDRHEFQGHRQRYLGRQTRLGIATLPRRGIFHPSRLHLQCLPRAGREDGLGGNGLGALRRRVHRTAQNRRGPHLNDYVIATMPKATTARLPELMRSCGLPFSARPPASNPSKATSSYWNFQWSRPANASAWEVENCFSSKPPCSTVRTPLSAI